MADNVTVNAGTFATDDVDGVHYQRIKLDLGGDGVASPLIRGQQTAALALPVVGASDLDGVATDTPSTDEEGAAARTKISLLKGIKNYLRTLATGVTVSSSALPAGAATAAKQPAPGTVGDPSTDVLTVQGDADGTPVPVSVADINAGALAKGKSVSEKVTCTNADTDYPMAAAMAAGTKYLEVYCASACKVAMGEATSATCGRWVPAGSLASFPVTVTGTAADDKCHVQSPTAGAEVWFTSVSE